MKMSKAKKEKYERNQFTLDECKTQINIIEKSDDKGYATAFLNIRLPDGRWLTFSVNRDHRVPLWKEKKE